MTVSLLARVRALTARVAARPPREAPGLPPDLAHLEAAGWCVIRAIGGGVILLPPLAADGALEVSDAQR